MAGLVAVVLATRPDLVLVRTVGFSVTAGAYAGVSECHVNVTAESTYIGLLGGSLLGGGGLLSDRLLLGGSLLRSGSLLGSGGLLGGSLLLRGGGLLGGSGLLLRGGLLLDILLGSLLGQLGAAGRT